jgi:hypothetical protein
MVGGEAEHTTERCKIGLIASWVSHGSMRSERGKEVREQTQGRERMRAATAEAYNLIPGS